MTDRKRTHKTDQLVSNDAPRIRCAIYTRKSTDEGLEQAFNTLDAQRESAEDFIRSHRHEGWETVGTRYDDGGYSGADMNRPAFQKLLADIRAGRVDCVVTYKIDRITRSLLDFSRIVETFDQHGTTLVAVTQQFNTSSSIGRLTLNILLSFAQFERELISERTRDKMAAARRKGKWTGGNPILGYDVSPSGGALVMNETEASKVRQIFEWYLQHGSLLPVVAELNRCGWTTKTWKTKPGRIAGGKVFTKNRLYNLLTNITYTGQVAFGGEVVPGEQRQIVDAEVFSKVQLQLRENSRNGGKLVRNKHSAVLKGILICASCNAAMTHTYTKKGSRLYRYYICVTAHQRGWNKCLTRSVSAPGIEAAVLNEIRAVGAHPDVLLRVHREMQPAYDGTRGRNARGICANAAGKLSHNVATMAETLRDFDPVWTVMTAHEQQAFVKTLVDRVLYDGPTGEVTVRFRSQAGRNMCLVQDPQNAGTEAND